MNRTLTQQTQDLPQTPPAGGYLPYWLLITAGASVYNSVQNYFILWQTREIYGPKAHEGTRLLFSSL